MRSADTMGHDAATLTTPPMTIISVPLEEAESKQGVVFWWSNILRGYQLRFYAPVGTPSAQSPNTQTSATPPPEMAHLPQIYLSRAEVEAAAITLAKHFAVPIYEIQIPRINDLANENRHGIEIIDLESIDIRITNE